ncbi:MAG: MFS transporter [Pseudomonadota bacterium]
MQVRNLVTLVFCQLISATGSIVMVTLGGIIGSQLGSSQALSTLPLSMIVIAMAATTIPATMLMRSIGRRKGFALASASAVVALGVAILALGEQSFLLFCVAAMLFGINMAFTHQYRYAAAESVATRYVPRAVSLVLVGSIGGALLGPELAVRGVDWVETIPYAGTMFALMALYALQAVLFLSMGVLGHDHAAEPEDTGRRTATIVRQPVFVVAVLGGVAGYCLMTLVMTATPLSMHVAQGFSLEETANVIRFHVLGMYIPSLFAGFIIERIGVSRLMFAGAVALIGTSVIGLQGHSYMHYR